MQQYQNIETFAFKVVQINFLAMHITQSFDIVAPSDSRFPKSCISDKYLSVQMMFLAMHITNQKLSFDIFTVGNLQNIFMEHDLYLIS